MPRKKVTEETVKKYISDNRINSKFIKLELIKDKSGRVRYWVYFVCSCGNPHKSDWSNFKKTQNCSECGKEKGRLGGVRYNEDYVVDYLKEFGYEIIGEYVNSGVSFMYRCLTCGNTGMTNFGVFIEGRRCRVCKGLAKKDTDSFNKIVKEITDDEYEFIGNYETAHVKSLFLHKTCNNTYNATPHNFLMGRRCPNCRASKGEKKIEDFLIKHDFTFESQFRAEECKYILPLPFDFALLDSKNKVKCLIEYDGEQHFKPIAYFGGEDNLSYIKKNDEIKNKYCLKNNIPLIRIPYWDFDRIEEILNNKLLHLLFKKEEKHVSVI